MLPYAAIGWVASLTLNAMRLFLFKFTPCDLEELAVYSHRKMGNTTILLFTSRVPVRCHGGIK